MGIRETLKRLGCELDHEFGSSEERPAVWVDRRTGMGIVFEWFRLPEVIA